MGWTADDIPDLSGRRAIVTGANSGLGYHTALQLARHGAAVVMACRSAERGQEAFDRILAAVPKGDVSLESLDLADLSSVRAFAVRVADQDGPLDILVNNAGVMALPRRTTADGFEMQFGTNHLGHFALTGLLLPKLLAADAPRVVTVASAVGYLGRLRFNDLQGERRYNKWSAYAQSKFANLVFAKELDRRVDRLTSMASHPGYAATNLQTAGPRMSGRRLEERGAEITTAVIGQSAAAGALPSLFAATAPNARGGAVYGPRLAQLRGAPARVFATPTAGKPELGRRLWEVSEDLTGVTYDIPTS